MPRHEQPNILVIMADEQAPQASELYGHPYVKTPHLKKLGESGVVFDQAYSDCPLCTPQRASFMTGLKVHRHGVWDNGVPLQSDIPTFAHMLAIAGYQTILSGKMHFIGSDQLHGFEKRLTPDCNYPGIMAQDWDHKSTPIAKGTGMRLHEAGPREDAVINYFDDLVEKESLSYLDQYKQEGEKRPFALVTSFIAPHFPLTPEPKYYEMYQDIVTLPKKRPEDASYDHPAMERLRQFFNFGEIDEKTLLRARAAYFGLITQTDDRVGRILSHLQSLDLMRPTVIIYVADHGEMMGEHGLWWKSCFYEESVKVPLIISSTDPTWFKPRRESMPVTLLDVTKTILSISQTKADISDLDGIDLTPYLEGKPSDPSRIITSEYHAHGTSRSMAMVRQHQYKLNYVMGEGHQLFDLDQDPHEWYDLSQDPSKKELCTFLLSQATIGWPPDVEQKVLTSLKRRKLINDAEKILPYSVDSLWIDVGADKGWEGDNF